MAWWNPFERRVSQSADDFWQNLTGNPSVTLYGFGQSASGAVVNIETALKVPAVSAAVNVLSGSLAGLPLHTYRRGKNGRDKVSGRLATLLHDAPNAYISSFDWRKKLFSDKLTHGRGLSYIERAENGSIMAIWPLDPARVVVKRDRFVNTYHYSEGGRTIIYDAAEIIDLPFMLKSDGYSHRGPVAMGKDAIGLAISVNEYGSKFLANGGVPPFAVTGQFQSGAALQRASDDLAKAVKNAAKENRQALTLPAGLDIKPIGTEPEKTQMVETQKYCTEQIARLYNIPPTFLQDLSHGTYSNSEQQDLHFVKHTLKSHVEQFEQELNLKLFGQFSRSQYVELNMDGLLRGEFKTRMEGWARGVQTGIIKPSEVREAENLPFADGSDQLFMQGATVPIGQTNPDGGTTNAA
ncbi:phage portal protein [Novosphingobium sp. KN65.2]|uniref:phage portal protein n=1 Tax=Novosphingobium sp. KN65.2 TaxID=1478134 RepID=UPI0005E3DAF4|nr:phage portal protein [Novosphingobium sp. KN65.2]CDO37136.1 Portal protein, HK97 family [Novosphingobium sp. KN65.2]